jgi:tripartite-type tricarboxylate transporter receptor subunit TctC
MSQQINFKSSESIKQLLESPDFKKKVQTHTKIDEAKLQ